MTKRALYKLALSLILLLGLFCALLGVIIYSNGLPLPVLANKVHHKLEQNYPRIHQLLAPLLLNLSSKRMTTRYPDVIDPLVWQGTGAHAFKKNTYPATSQYQVDTKELLLLALQQAKAGDKIEILPGVYELEGLRLRSANSGENNKPITLFSKQLGQVTLLLNGEGIKVEQAFWTFKNLRLKGRCEQHSLCEHAFHVVGDAHHAVFENNIFEDFNAAIKINGIEQKFPDDGLIINNTFFNRSVRYTANPVTPIDLMQANNWKVTENLIFDFVKGAGNKISYGAFFKGGSANGEFSKNVIMCHANISSRNDLVTVGLSLGGGGSNNNLHRDNLVFEHAHGLIRNNIIMHCDNGEGIYLNNSANSIVSHNIIYNTLGLTARFKESQALVHHNIISGVVNAEQGSVIHHDNNLINPNHWLTGRVAFDDIFTNPSKGNFSWRVNNPMTLKNAQQNKHKYEDFCEQLSLLEYQGAYSGLRFCSDQLNTR